MKWNKLLEKQMAKHLPPHICEQEEWQSFFQAVNASYVSYDRDHILTERAFKLSEEEFAEVNEQLKEELTLKKLSIDQLQQAIGSLAKEGLATQSDNLLDIVLLLKDQIQRRKEAEETMQATASRLSYLISNMQSGILVEDEHRHIVVTNQVFCKLFDIPAAPEQLIGASCANAAEQSKHMFRSPEQFVQRIGVLLQQQQLVVNEELLLHDGRVFERTYIPIFLHSVYKGHLWNYVDITERKQAEARLKASEELWHFALEGAGDGVWEYNPNQQQVRFSSRYVQMLGWKADELECTPEAWLSRMHPDDRYMIEEVAEGYTNGSLSSHQLEYRVLHESGEYVWILDRGMVVTKDHNGFPERIVGTHANITERKQAEEVLQRREEKYRNIIANMNLGLIELNEEGLVQYVNHRFCEMSGFAAEELTGKKASSLFAHGANSKLLEEKIALRKKGVSDAYELAVKNKRGELKWWFISGAPLYNDNGALAGSIGIYLDITDRKKLEFELYEAREAAEQSARAKESFLANMSHEIRTPMNAILGMSRQLEKTRLDSEQARYLQTILTATDHLMVVINDILDMSKIQAGMLNIEAIGFNIEGVIRHAVQTMQQKAEDKHIYLRVEVDRKIAPVLIGDPHRLNQVMLNLLSNAVKFTEEGGVVITAGLLGSMHGKQQIEVRVKDTGIGMDGSFLDSLFDKFAQEDISVARKFGGTGLGMAITRQLVELMQGNISVASEKGKGTEFIITLSFAMGTQSDLPVRVQTEVNSAILEGKHVLLAEDYEMNRIVVQTILKRYGVYVTEAENGAVAVELLKQQPFDLVLMDVQMPVMSGMEVTSIARQELGLTVPIIALTANAVKGESERCMAGGMTAYLSKPYKEAELIKVMANCLGGVATVNAGPDEETVKAVNAELPLYSLNKLNELGNGDTDFLERMVQLFVQHVPVSVQAIEMAWEQKDYDTIRAQAHKLKPAINNMDIHPLKEVVREIEMMAEKDMANPQLPLHIATLQRVIEEVLKQLRSAQKATD